MTKGEAENLKRINRAADSRRSLSVEAVVPGQPLVCRDDLDHTTKHN